MSSKAQRNRRQPNVGEELLIPVRVTGVSPSDFGPEYSRVTVEIPGSDAVVTLDTKFLDDGR